MIKNLSFTDLLSTSLSLISSSVFNIILVIIFIVIGYLLIKSDNKYSKYKSHILITSIIILVIILICYNGGLLKTIDYLVNNLFMLFTFPNLLAYIIGLIILNLIVWKLFFNKNTSRKIKVLSLIVYLIITYFSIILLEIISKSKLNVFKLDDVYMDVNALSLIRLSSIIFVIYLLFLIIYKIYLHFLNKGKLEIPKYVKEEYTVNKRKLPDYINEVDYPKLAIRDSKEYIPTEELRDLEKNLSLDDYKLLVKLLVDHKNKEELKDTVAFKDLSGINVREVPGVKEMLERVEPISTIPTLEQVMPIYKTELISRKDEEEVTKTVEKIEDNVYRAKTNRYVQSTDVETSTLKKDKVEELLRLYQS